VRPVIRTGNWDYKSIHSNNNYYISGLINEDDDSMTDMFIYHQNSTMSTSVLEVTTSLMNDEYIQQQKNDTYTLVNRRTTHIIIRIVHAYHLHDTINTAMHLNRHRQQMPPGHS
jgi:hypothetical protein